MSDSIKELSPMLKEIIRTPQIMRDYFGDLNKATRMAFSHEDILQSRKIIITGSGDSYFAGVATKYAFEKYAGLSTVAAPGMEVSRYYFTSDTNLDFKDTLVLGISVSGEISRSVEAIKRANQKNALSSAITGDPNSRLGTEVARIIKVPKIPKVTGGEHVPGTWSYTISMMALYLLAYHFAEVHDRLFIEEVNQFGRDILGLADQVEKAINNIEKPMEKLAEKWQYSDKFLFLGSGPNYATALFSAAKIIEATGRFAVALDIEEYAHLYHFCNDLSIPIIVFLPNGNATSRAVELIELMRKHNRNMVIITTADCPIQKSDDVIQILDTMDEITSPLILSMVGNLFAAHLHDILNVPYFNGFPPDPNPNGNTIVTSKVETL